MTSKQTDIIYKVLIALLILAFTGFKLLSKYQREQIQIQEQQEQRKWHDKMQEIRKEKEKQLQTETQIKKLDSINEIRKDEQEIRRKELRKNLKKLEKEMQ